MYDSLAGIWKGVSLVAIPAASVALTELVPLIYYQGDFPTTPLSDAAHGGFVVDVHVHVWSPAGATVAVTAAGKALVTIVAVTAAGEALSYHYSDHCSR